jgi:glycosyltransferase involved in cell wall biosynthesis
LQKKYIPLCFASADKLIAVGNGLKDAMRLYTSRPVTVIYNLVRLNLFFPLIDKKESGNIFRFFSLGMSSYIKGFDILITAYSKSSILESTELCIAGLEENEMATLNEMVVQYGLEKRVALWGKLSREETAREMRNADCFVPGQQV